MVQRVGGFRPSLFAMRNSANLFGQPHIHHMTALRTTLDDIDNAARDQATEGFFDASPEQGPLLPASRGMKTGASLSFRCGYASKAGNRPRYTIEATRFNGGAVQEIKTVLFGWCAVEPGIDRRAPVL